MLQFNASSIESWVDWVDDAVDDLAPRLAPELPEVAVAVPIVDGIRKLADLILASPLATPAQTATVSAAMTQLNNAIVAQPAVPPEAAPAS